MADWKAMRPETLAAQALGRHDAASGGVVPALHPASTFLVGGPDGRTYARADNPSFEAPEALLTALEGGAASLLFSSGMAAASAVFLTLEPGAHVVAPRVMYWGLRNWLMAEAPRRGVEVELVEAGSLTALKAAMRPGKTALVWIETPANPLWTVTDIAAAAEIAHGAGARLGVDSTTATPVLTRPLELGADIVMHSATKYLNGHSDLVAGALVTREADEAWSRIVAWRSGQGAILGTFEAWLLLRGMRTLPLRVAAASRNAMAVAEAMQAHDAVSDVLYPGLSAFAGHDVAARQMRGGFGGMLSIRLKGGREAALAAASATQFWKQATSLGGVESLIEHRASTEGPASPVPDDLLRLSVGIEAAEDLIADLGEALGGAAD